MAADRTEAAAAAARSAAGWSGQFTVTRVVSEYSDRSDPPAADYFHSNDRLTAAPESLAGPTDLLVSVTVATSWD